MLSYHDNKTRESIQDFQAATVSAKASFDEQESRLKHLQEELSALQRNVAGIDEKLRYNSHTVSVLEEQETRLKAMRRGHEAELEKQTHGLAALRKPREDAEADRKKIADEVDAVQGLIMSRVTALATGIVQAANDASLVPELRRNVQDKKMEAEKWNNAVGELELQAEKEGAALAELRAQLEELKNQKQQKILTLKRDAAAAASIAADKKKNRQAKNNDTEEEDDDDDDDDHDNNETLSPDAASSPRKNKKNQYHQHIEDKEELDDEHHDARSSSKQQRKKMYPSTPTTFSSLAEKVSFDEKRLLLTKESHVKEETALAARRDELRRKNFELCQQTEELDSDMQEVQQKQCDLLDELANMICSRCGVRTLSAESGHDASP